MITGWYYLHENNDLIYKPNHDGVAADIRESDFARAMWAVDPSDRESAWSLLVEALSLGATAGKIQELSQKWGCDDKDADVYADRLGLRIYLDGNAWCATCADFIDLQTSPAGFGETKLEAMASLCGALGYTGGKMWNTTFKRLALDSPPPAPTQSE